MNSVNITDEFKKAVDEEYVTFEKEMFEIAEKRQAITDDLNRKIIYKKLNSKKEEGEVIG
jgi:hypothetical protein